MALISTFPSLPSMLEEHASGDAIASCVPHANRVLLASIQLRASDEPPEKRKTLNIANANGRTTESLEICEKTFLHSHARGLLHLLGHVGLLRKTACHLECLVPKLNQVVIGICTLSDEATRPFKSLTHKSMVHDRDGRVSIAVDG